MDYPIIKYPRTPIWRARASSPGREDLSQVPFSCPAGRRLTRGSLRSALGSRYVLYGEWLYA